MPTNIPPQFAQFQRFLSNQYGVNNPMQLREKGITPQQVMQDAQQAGVQLPPPPPFLNGKAGFGGQHPNFANADIQGFQNDLKNQYGINLQNGPQSIMEAIKNGQIAPEDLKALAESHGLPPMPPPPPFNQGGFSNGLNQGLFG